MIDQDVEDQYRTTDLLRIRAETHARYTENPVDLDLECARVLGLAEDESLLDVGCGPGVFLRYLRTHGHRGRLAGIDQSTAMIGEAAESSAGADIEWFTGAADALPFPDGAFTAVSARHMLYHVPDVPAALAEFARVVGPGGTVFAATNDLNNLPLISAVEDDLYEHFGLPKPPWTGASFNTVNAPDLLGSIYPEVSATILANALVITEPEPIVRYVMTMSGIQQAGKDPALLTQMHEWLTAAATERLAQMGGVWRDTKAVGLYLCRCAD